MSTSQISPVYDLGTRADYLRHGKGSKAAKHRAHGTNRIAPGFYCDASSVDQFIELGNHLASAHGRRVKAHSIILSFSPEELSVDSDDDLQLVGDAGLELARRAFPNSPVMVVVHDDSAGKNPHAHITVLNHDMRTGKAPKANRTHSQIKPINDQLMRDLGLSVTGQHTGTGFPWPERRAERQARIEAGSPRRDDAFKVALGDAVAEAHAEVLAGDLADPRAALEAALESRGVALAATRHKVETDARAGHRRGDTVEGWTYTMLDPEPTPGARRRRRRSKASELASSFTSDGFDKAVEVERQRRAAEASRQDQAAQRATQAQARVAELRAAGLVPDAPVQAAEVLEPVEAPEAIQAPALDPRPEATGYGARPPGADQAAQPAGRRPLLDPGKYLGLVGGTAQAPAPAPAPSTPEPTTDEVERPRLWRTYERAGLDWRKARKLAPAAKPEPEPTSDAVEPVPPAPVPAVEAAAAPTEPEDKAEAPEAQEGAQGAAAPAYCSPMRDLIPPRERDREFYERLAVLDEHVEQQTAAGELIDDALMKGIGMTHLTRYRSHLAHATVQALLVRSRMRRAAQEAHELGDRARAQGIRGRIAQGRYWDPATPQAADPADDGLQAKSEDANREETQPGW
ncbi:relaxase/mobilization nuclease domain-containing protein [Micrococcus luteus]|uniref:relaxase/mobilization nuclease domain-containing protein n=1 Tax=Micrococcus luteus TaxID=1270 RepID=UPI0013E917E7|nr:relaxase/mobilization nuclease domain-containing protein [Micrococcus luteus]